MVNDAELPGLTLNSRYTDLIQIGAGGMARVFRARDVAAGCFVAVKILRPEAATRRGLLRFDREIRVIRSLVHENVLSLLDAGVVPEGEFSGCPFFVMPLVAGESLRARLERERQLQVAEAVRIVTGIAKGLSAAHALGVVHRDVKPENVLLDGDRVLVTDFGIARVSDAEDGITSSTGVVVGTPTYMSPEQVAGDLAVDRRSDLYGLGIVTYELLAGSPPFTASSPQALSARHLLEPPPPLRVVRPDVDEQVWNAINRALAKVPAGRQESCEAYIEELAGTQAYRPGTATPSRQRWLIPGVLVGALGVAGVAWLATRRPAPAVDPLRVVVLPWADAASLGPNPEEPLRSALRAWNGLTVVDQLETPRLVGKDQSLAAMAAQARRVSAGLLITGTVTQGDSGVLLSAALIDVHNPSSVLRTFQLRWPAGRSPSDSSFRSLAEELLLPEPARGAGSHTYPAALAFANGMDAVARWELPNAETALESAALSDQRFSRALLWLALVRTWRERPTPEWGYLLARARAGDTQLDRRESALLTALTQQAVGDLVSSCKTWRGLTQAYASDFAAWYGLAYCLRSDAIVVPDRKSPSGWRFRSDKPAAIAAYRRALELLPASHRALASHSFEVVRRSLLTSMTYFLEGRTETGDMEFAGLPALERGKLVMQPIPRLALQSGDPGSLPPSHQQAVLGQRRLFDSLTATWASAFPQSSDALLARAIALEMMGDERMFLMVGAARTAAVSTEARLGTGVEQVRMLVKRGVDSPSLMLQGRALADSLLLQYSSAPQSDYAALATLASLVGKVDVAARLLRHSGTNAERPRTSIEVEADVLLLFAASGASHDSVTALSRRIQPLLAVQEPSLRDAMEMAWVARAATLSFPNAIPDEARALGGRGDYLLDAQLLMVRGDTAEAMRRLVRVVSRRTAPSADQPLDAVCPESATAAAAGDTAMAYKWISASLSSFSRSPPDALSDHTAAALLGRCLFLASRLAIHEGDTEASRRWSAAARALAGRGSSEGSRIGVRPE